MAPLVSTDSSSLPAGHYKVVCLALDLTGKKGPSIEEICQIGAYYPSEQPRVFSQYVMPFRDISPSSIRVHGVRTFTTFGYFFHRLFYILVPNKHHLFYWEQSYHFNFLISFPKFFCPYEFHIFYPSGCFLCLRRYHDRS